MIEPGVYEHYKGRRYEVLTTARHSETEEWFVVYRQQYGDGSTWVRPLEMFDETVEVDGRTMPRFRRVDDGPRQPE
ncbi:DUF1653 domain-containing protein [Agromyces aurantiacus]|uniref:DUF1653 domain-containing protein n=1 Tax=Agromyces aurantiacus TaxID=165814 RepID=A0ABV9R8F5_9MICO|nr:DUF1653 domain-containing protein [Agromyces aurantiacus]MBM7505241.1 hypothetical protein [Agromyces aurantiacus]